MIEQWRKEYNQVRPHSFQEYRLNELNNKPLLAVMEEQRQDANASGDRSWVREVMGEVKARLAAASVPIYPSIERAAGAASKLIDYYQRREPR